MKILIQSSLLLKSFNWRLVRRPRPPPPRQSASQSQQPSDEMIPVQERRPVTIASHVMPPRPSRESSFCWSDGIEREPSVLDVKRTDDAH